MRSRPIPPTPGIHRRAFLARAAAVGCGVGGLVLAPIGPAAADESEVARYAGAVGTAFRLRGASGLVCEVVLDRVDVRGAPRGGPGRRAPFSLTFRAPAGRAVPQDVYRLDHPSIGRARLLLVPIGPPRDGAILEAVFG
jgi:hypothetical protein